MPAPQFVRADLSDLVCRQVALEDLRNEEVQIEVKLPEKPLFADIDPSMISGQQHNKYSKERGRIIANEEA